MFFGKKPEPEKVQADRLSQYLNQLFDEKLGRFSSNAKAIAIQLPVLKESFIKDCDEFEKIDAEPYTDYMWNPNINSIKSQKISYTDTLRNLASNFSSEVNAPNSYVRYKLIMLNIDDLLNSILRYNSNYKTVLYCYPSHLRGFKKTFSSIERLRDSLKAELDSRESDYDAYNSINSRVSKFSIDSEEIKVLKESLSAIEASTAKQERVEIDNEEIKIAEKMSAKRSELAKAQLEVSSSRNKLRIQTAPLDRASKKFDHISKRKKQLNYFVRDPATTIKSEGDYADFLELLKEMKTEILNVKSDAESLGIKNKPEVLEIISGIMESDLYSSIHHINQIDTAITDLISEIKELERVSYSINEVRAGRARSGTEADRIKNELKALEDSKVRVKGEIEKLFADSYSRPVIITE